MSENISIANVNELRTFLILDKLQLIESATVSRQASWLAVGLFVVMFIKTHVSKKNGNAFFKAPFVGPRYAWLARWLFFQSAEQVIETGHTIHANEPWKLTGNDVIVLPHKYLDEIRKLPPAVANAMEANLDNMQSRFTHLDVLNTTRLFVTVLKHKLNPQLAMLVPTLRKELDFAMQREIPECRTDEWHSISTFETFHHIVARVSARIFGGRELRDDAQWLGAAQGYLHNIFKTAIAIRLIPNGFKTIGSWFVPCSWEIGWNSWKAKRILIPYIQYRKQIMQERSDEIERNGKGEFPDMLQYLIEAAEGKDAEDMSLAAMVLSLSLASNHTTTMALVEAIYDLCAHPEYQEELRQEVQEAINLKGGWHKTTMLRMRKLDSFIKESQRMHPPSLMGYKRKLRERVTLNDGLTLPKGAHIEFAIVPIQRDHTNNPTQFDGLRYYRMRQEPGAAHRHQFATTSASSLHFGHGNNSCPGRFMASSVIKMVLGTLLTEFDFKLEEPGRPSAIHAFEYNFPSPTAKLMLRKRNPSGLEV